jgi:hypothetical protein
MVMKAVSCDAPPPHRSNLAHSVPLLSLAWFGGLRRILLSIVAAHPFIHLYSDTIRAEGGTAFA